jgi:hypothetical protein
MSESEIKKSETLHDSSEIDIMMATCELCSKSCSTWSISMNTYIYLGIWDTSTHRIMSFCSHDCMKLWHTLHDKK